MANGNVKKLRTKLAVVAATPQTTTNVVIKPINFAQAAVKIIGTAPYLQNRFSSDNREKMVAKQKKGKAGNAYHGTA